MTTGGRPESSRLALIVADDSTTRLLVRESLITAGYRTIEAPDERTALDCFREARPDIILLDLDLSGLNGLTTCQVIRSMPEGKYLPILMITDSAHSWAQSFDAGTTDFVSKPVKPELLVYRVAYMLRASQRMQKLTASEAQLAHAQKIAHLGNWEWDTGTDIFCCSREALNILGLAGEPVTITDFFGAIHHLDRAGVAHRLRETAASGTPYVGEVRIACNGAQPRVVRVQGSTEANGNRLPPLMVGTIQDITDMKQSEAQLKLLKVAIDSLPIGITISDVEGRIIYANPAEAKIHNLTIDELVGRKGADFGPSYLRKPRLPELIDHNYVWRRESINVRSNGEEFPVKLSSIAVRDADGNCLGMVTACEDITPWKEAEERINQLAYFDTLTGLANRRNFFNRLTQAIALAHREERQVGLLFFDLDNFKDINDTLGHDFGDRLLQHVANRLTEIMRESDTLARLGGDEFVIVLTSIINLESAAIVARRILAILSRPFQIEGKQVFSSTSIGIALFPDDGHDPEDLFKCADTAMYHAKETGKSTFRFFSSEMNRNIMRRVALESGLRQGLDNKEFFLHFQPQWDLQTEKIIGVEALVRWQSPDFGLVMPAEFISLAECTGLIVALGEWVLHTACLQARQWQEAGHERLRVAINISGKQLVQPNFFDTARSILAETGVNPAAIEFEFTESVLMDNAEKVVGTLRALKGLGLQLSIDDFGTGYSSLSYLKHFTIDRVKIDRAFVMDITRSKDDAAIVDAIISMSHSLNLKVIAEGVETPEQLQFLKEHHCDEIQGFYLARPMTAEDLEQQLTTFE